MIYVQLFHLEEFLGVLLWSLALLSVAVGELLVALGILLDIENIALVNLLHSGKQSSAVGVAEFSGVKVISHVTSTTVPVRVVPGPVPWIQDPAVVY